jgi:hypothetical protein
VFPEANLVKLFLSNGKRQLRGLGTQMLSQIVGRDSTTPPLPMVATIPVDDGGALADPRRPHPMQRLHESWSTLWGGITIVAKNTKRRDNRALFRYWIDDSRRPRKKGELS